MLNLKSQSRRWPFRSPGSIQIPTRWVPYLSQSRRWPFRSPGAGRAGFHPTRTNSRNPVDGHSGLRVIKFSKELGVSGKGRNPVDGHSGLREMMVVVEDLS